MPPSPALKTVRYLPLKLPGQYICPTCSFRNVSTQFRKRKKNCQRKPPPARRAVSTISSVTAVNAKKDIPHAFRDLYEGLTVLQKEAAVYTKLGQLQLALRGLESENGITRVAGMSQSQSTFQRHLLIAYSSERRRWTNHSSTGEGTAGRPSGAGAGMGKATVKPG